MNSKYNQIVVTQKELSQEIIKVCDDYRSRAIDQQEFMDVINFYAEKYPGRLFNAAELNPTISKIIGVKRVSMLDMVLEKLK